MVKSLRITILALLITLNFASTLLGQNSVMSYNIRNMSRSDGEYQWKFRKEKLVEKLQNDDVDVIGLQEAQLPQIEYIEDNLHQYAWVGVGRDNGAKKGEYTPIFYKKDKFALVDWGAEWLSPTPHKPSKGWDAANKRTAVWAILKVNNSDQQFLFINTHFDHRGKTAQLNSSKQIINLADSLTARHGTMPIAITGDFNATAADSALTPLLASFDYALMACESYDSSVIAPTFVGFPGRNATPSPIDFIYTRGYIIESYVVDTTTQGLSDHRSATIYVQPKK